MYSIADSFQLDIVEFCIKTNVLISFVYDSIWCNFIPRDIFVTMTCIEVQHCFFV